MKYVKNNALKARVFKTLDEQNEFLLDWEQHVANTRNGKVVDGLDFYYKSVYK